MDIRFLGVEVGMTIGIDLRCLPIGKDAGAGIPHVARELTRALLRIGCRHTWILFLPELAEFEIEEQALKIPYKFYLKKNSSAGLREALRLYPCDVLFVPSGAIAFGMSIPAVPVVHDIAIFSHPEWFPQNFFRRQLTTRICKRGILQAPIVLSMSDATRVDMLHAFHISESRIRVIHAGGDSVLAELRGDVLQDAKKRAKESVKNIGLNKPFILCLGTLEPRKNISMLLRARPYPADLVIAGRDGWKCDIQNIDSHIHRISELSDIDRRELLLAADVVAIPSLHEGFGLVALEAMQAGTAIVASDVGALPEVIGDAGILIPPLDEHAWSIALQSLLLDEEKRKMFAFMGKERSQNFSWHKSAEITLDALTGALI